MEGIISFGNKRSYEDFKKQIPSSVLPLFDSIRKFCFSLGENVVEDVRMHRVVFCKSITFRWFVDIEPETKVINDKGKEEIKEFWVINEDSGDFQNVGEQINYLKKETKLSGING